ncbi:hypothetical protein BJ742DRAFT_12257 [Cladochytrium replicatum]|nr:hypothetical protein BJ742DRAFT_12257 [Cladochytrium replicatum]
MREWKRCSCQLFTVHTWYFSGCCGWNESDTAPLGCRYESPTSAVGGSVASVRLLCDKGINLDATDEFGSTALHYAAQQDFASCVYVLTRKGAPVNVGDSLKRTPLMWGAIEGRFESITILLNAKADIDAPDLHGSTALHASAYGGYSQCCSHLIRSGANISAMDKRGHTPIFRAIVGGWLEPTIALLVEGCEVNLADMDGRHPLHWAASAGFLEHVKVLINFGAEINAPDNKGTTPIHEAAFQGHSEVVSQLIRCGADINARDNQGFCTLHWGAINGHIEVCRILVSNGAFVNQMEQVERCTPLSLALENGHVACAHFFQNVGGLTSDELRKWAAQRIQRAWKMHEIKKMLWLRTLTTSKQRVSSAQQARIELPHVRNSQDPGSDSLPVIGDSSNPPSSDQRAQMVDISGKSARPPDDPQDTYEWRQSYSTESILKIQTWWRMASSRGRYRRLMRVRHPNTEQIRLSEQNELIEIERLDTERERLRIEGEKIAAERERMRLEKERHRIIDERRRFEEERLSLELQRKSVLEHKRKAAEEWTRAKELMAKATRLKEDFERKGSRWALRNAAAIVIQYVWRQRLRRKLAIKTDVERRKTFELQRKPSQLHNNLQLKPLQLSRQQSLIPKEKFSARMHAIVFKPAVLHRTLSGNVYIPKRACMTKRNAVQDRFWVVQGTVKRGRSVRPHCQMWTTATITSALSPKIPPLQPRNIQKLLPSWTIRRVASAPTVNVAQQYVAVRRKMTSSEPVRVPIILEKTKQEAAPRQTRTGFGQRSQQGYHVPRSVPLEISHGGPTQARQEGRIIAGSQTLERKLTGHNRNISGQSSPRTENQNTNSRPLGPTVGRSATVGKYPSETSRHEIQAKYDSRPRSTTLAAPALGSPARIPSHPTTTGPSGGEWMIESFQNFDVQKETANLSRVGSAKNLRRIASTRSSGSPLPIPKSKSHTAQPTLDRTYGGTASRNLPDRIRASHLEQKHPEPEDRFENIAFTSFSRPGSSRLRATAEVHRKQT